MEVWQELVRSIEVGDALLFAGAGCSARINIPVWGPYPELLATREAKGAVYCTVPFVLFLHGRASIPTQAEQSVFDREDYNTCYSDPAYTDGLLQLLSTRTCVFIGFSFKDPGIEALPCRSARTRGFSLGRRN